MVHRKRSVHTAFTLVELMIVVAIIGILAAIAIPAFSRYIKKSRTSEALEGLSKMWAGSVTYYETDHMDTNQVALEKRFPGHDGSNSPYEDWAGLGQCGCRTGAKCPGGPPLAGVSFEVFNALDVSLPDPHAYNLRYFSNGSGTAATFTARAEGDLDCDAVISTFQRVGSIDAATRDVTGSSAPFVVNELE